MSDRTYAPIALDCPSCGLTVDLKIPVDFELFEDSDGDDAIRAVVNQEEDYVEPLWRHVFDEHGPKL